MRTLLAVISVLFFAANAEATTWWVSATGGSTGNCSTAQGASDPGTYIRTITAGLACVGSGGGTAGAGHTVMVKNGTYNEQMANKLPGGTSASRFTLKSQNKWGAVIAPTPGTIVSSHNAINQDSLAPASYITIDGIDFDGGPSHDNNCQDGPGGIGVSSGGGTNWIIQNNRFRNWTAEGVAGASGVNGFQFLGNYFDGNGDLSGSEDPNKCHGVYWGAMADAIFDGNTFTNHNYGYGLHIYDGNGSTNNIVRNNIFFNNGTLVIGAPWNARKGKAAVIQGSGQLVYNNVFYNNPLMGLEMAWGVGCANCNVFENTFYNNGTGLWVQSRGIDTNIQVRNNIFWQNGTDFQDDFGTTTSNNRCTNPGTGCATSGDPLFVDATGGNFRLQPGSLALNIPGASLNSFGSIYALDIAGVPRPQGANWDLGAYELGGAPTSPPSIAITGPVSTPTFSTTADTLNLSGTASSNGGTGLAVTWSCDRCGPVGDSGGGADSGSASGTTTWKTASPLQLRPGVNILTATATDSGGITNDTLTVTYTPTFPGNALVGAWGFEEGSGLTSVDSSGNTNTANLANGAAWTTQGKYGNAVSFDGVNDYVWIADAASLDFTQSFTFSAWVQPTISRTDLSPIMSKNSNGDYVQFLYSTASGFGSCGSGSVLGGIKTNGSVGPPFTVCDSTPPLSVLQPGQWSHVALTYDNASALLALYVNGVQVGTFPASGLMEPSTGNLWLGRTIFDEYFQGKLDEVRALNFAIPLTAGANSTPGAACGYADYTATVKATPTLASVVGDMNCAVIPANITPPLPIKFPASATGLKVGSSATGLKLGSK